MDALDAHPGKSREEEIVQQPCNHWAEQLMGVHVDAHQEDELRHEEAAAQVLMDGGPGALDLTKEPEGEDAHGQTDEGDDHPQLGDAGQDGIVRHQIGSARGHEDGEVCEVVAGAAGGIAGDVERLAAVQGPVALQAGCVVLPEGTLGNIGAGIY